MIEFFHRNLVCSSEIDPTPLRVRTWRNNGKCSVDVLNHFPLNSSIECQSNEGKSSCHQLRCGCRYQLKIDFNQTMIDSLCSKSSCDIQLNNPNLTTISFQTRRLLQIRSIFISIGFLSFDFSFRKSWKSSNCFDVIISERNRCGLWSSIGMFRSIGVSLWNNSLQTTKDLY